MTSLRRGSGSGSSSLDSCSPLRSLNTGDVLLYRTKDLGATFNAAAQGSFYSHVSMVVAGTSAELQELYPEDYKIGSGKLMKSLAADESTSEQEQKQEQEQEQEELAILEAVPKRGVALFPLRARLIRTIDSIKYLSVRRHSGIITDQSRANFHAFLKQILGRKLEMLTADMVRSLFHNRFRGKVLGIIKDKSETLTNKNSKENWDEFFCSELVAEALQQLEILREEGLSSNNLVPSSFAEPRSESKRKRGRSFDMPGERITRPGHSYGPEEVLLVAGDPWHKALKELKVRMKGEYKEAKKKQRAPTMVAN